MSEELNCGGFFYETKRLISRFRQFGGLRLLVEYARLGVIHVIVKGLYNCLINKKQFKSLYPDVLKEIEPFLKERFTPILNRRKEFYKKQAYEHNHSKIIWFCWLQGIDAAPEIVRTCYASLNNHFRDYEIKVISADNCFQYVELPGVIVKKWQKRLIPPALFSDLLRLQLLIKNGGTWIDATVLCTGRKNSSLYLNADLFLFQYSKQGSVENVSISNWFITAHSNNVVLMVLRDMLFEYWFDYNCTMDYYIFHLFFSMVAKEYPEIIASMPYGYSMWSLALMYHWNDSFDIGKWEKLTSKVDFHKLSYRVNAKVRDNKTNYYHWIMSNSNGSI